MLLGFCRGIWAVNTWTLQANIFGAGNLSKVAGFSQFGGGLVILSVPPLLTTFKDFAYIPIAAGDRRRRLDSFVNALYDLHTWPGISRKGL